MTAHRLARWWPRTLMGRVAWIVCGSLVLTHVLTVLIILRERGDVGQRMMLAYVSRDVATSMAILDRVPPAERPAWLPKLAQQNYGYAFGQASGVASDHALAHSLEDVVAAELGASRVGHALTTPDSSPWHPHLLLPLRLMDGSPVVLDLHPPRTTVSDTTLLLLGLQMLALGFAAWFSVRVAVRPLAQMVNAANALKPGQATQPLPEQGPQEVTAAARAFNAMQARIDAHLSERMQLLAAISHDLQSPITRLRLRSDTVGDEALRAKLHADLDDMQALVEEGLAYARTAQATQEALRPVDLYALLDSLVCDATDAGHQVSLHGPADLPPLMTRVQALRRLITNLLDNALKFAGQAEVHLVVTADALTISVLDKGPGIPPGELEAVLQPFYRVESSRNRETGGTGLGLAIAQQLALALSGRLSLSNRPQGGLQAQLTLPAPR